MNHFRDECKHGKLMDQCRCPSPDKEVRIVPCPASCQEEEVVVVPEIEIELGYMDIKDLVRFYEAKRDNALSNIVYQRAKDQIAQADRYEAARLAFATLADRATELVTVKRQGPKT